MPSRQVHCNQSITMTNLSCQFVRRLCHCWESDGAGSGLDTARHMQPESKAQSSRRANLAKHCLALHYSCRTRCVCLQAVLDYGHASTSVDVVAMAKDSSGKSAKHQSKPRKVHITVYKLVELSQSSKSTTYGIAGTYSQLLHSSSDFVKLPRVLQQGIGVEKASVFYDLKKERLDKAQTAERFQRTHSQQPANKVAAPAKDTQRDVDDDDDEDDEENHDLCQPVGEESSSDESDGEMIKWSGIPLSEAASACEKYISHKVRL